jgi:cytidylate kinase
VSAGAADRERAGPQPVVAIDGPSGSGKSTVGRAVAAALGLEVLDTGAMYRAVTLAAIDAGVDLDDAVAVAAVARDAVVELGDGRVLLGGRDVTFAIRTPEVTVAVSTVSSYPEVRRILVERQREWVARHDGGVVEGRDIGTIVFPEAPLKVFLTASEEERARRRQRDEADAARIVELERARDQLVRRDAADGTLGRATRPENAAPDAIVIDTTAVGFDDVVQLLLERAEQVFV